MEDGDGDGDDDGNGNGNGDILIKQSYATSSLKLHVYWTINQNL